MGGTVALSSHGTKAATRLAANTSPEPFSNIVLSLFEDAIAIGGTLLMTLHPVVILAMVAAALLISIMIFRVIRRAFVRLFGKRRVAGAPA
jgi:short subunit fatty acids transporter